MMRKWVIMARLKYLFVILALLLLPGTALAEDYNQRESLIVETLIRIPIEFEATGSSPSLSLLKINYSWMPRDSYRQETITLKTSPLAKVSETGAIFEIRKIEDFELSVDFKTKTTSEPVRVPKKIAFPIKDLDQSLLYYTKATELIDITPEISAQAASLAKGEDDLYVVAFKLADWVNTNIEYNLSTKTAEANLKSSWVLRERQGVCDELSNLYISMLRSLGIPAKFVTGLSYTESSLFAQSWGGHGWAEVYFPGHGWIPFDPTYDQLGYIDATHIKLDEDAEGNKYNTEYEWKGRSISVNVGEMQTNSYVIEKGEKREDNIAIDVSFMRQEIGFGSYNVIVATVKNQNGHYSAVALDLADTKSMETLSEKTVDILLKPYEAKKAYWLVRISKDLRNGFIYTFPASVYTRLDEEHVSEFKVIESGELVTRDTAEAYIGKSKETLSGITATCTPKEDTIYESQPATIECTIDNTGSFRTITVCWPETRCEKANLTDGINTLVKSITFNETGYKTIIVDFKTSKGSESAFVRINTIDSAMVEFQDIEYPEKMRYGEPSAIKFKIKKISKSMPKNITIALSNGVFLREWKMDFLPDEQALESELDSKYFKSQGNDLKLEAIFHDEAGKEYKTEKTIRIELIELTLTQRISLWFNSINSWLVRTFGE